VLNNCILNITHEANNLKMIEYILKIYYFEAMVDAEADTITQLKGTFVKASFLSIVAA